MQTRLMRIPFATLKAAPEALSDAIDLADAWATCGAEGYTSEERRRRDRAERALFRLDRWMARETGHAAKR